MKYNVVLYVIIILFMLAVAGCGTDPVGPSDAVVHDVYGEIVFLTTGGGIAKPGNVTVVLSGQGIEQQANVNEDGRFVFDRLEDGDYMISPQQDDYVFEPANYEILVSGKKTDAGLFYAGILGPDEYVIAGRVLDGASRPARDVSVVLHHPNGVNGYSTRDDGSFELSAYGAETLKAGETYSLSAEKPARFGAGFSLKPDTCYVKIESSISVCNFYHEQPLYSVTGRIIDRNEVDLEGVSIYIRGIDPPTSSFRGLLDDDGRYQLSSLPEGRYRLSMPGALNSWYHLEESDFEIVIDGGDVIAEDQYSYYDGPTVYWIDGLVTDSEGNGIPEATIDVEGVLYLVSNTITRDDGTYSSRVQLNKSNTETLLVSVRKPGFYFEPLNYDAGSVSWREGIRDGGKIEAPSFVGYDQEKFNAAPYFPLATGNSWTYERNGSTEDHWIVTVTGPSEEDGIIWFTMDGYGPGGYQVFRIAGNDVHVLDRDGRDTMFLQFGKEPGADWVVRRESELYDHIGSYHGAAIVSVPAGTFDCEVFSIDVQYGETTRQATRIWLSPDVGMVRMEQTLVDGDVIIDSMSDELVSFDIQY